MQMIEVLRTHGAIEVEEEFEGYYYARGSVPDFLNSSRSHVFTGLRES